MADDTETYLGGQCLDTAESTTEFSTRSASTRGNITHYVVVFNVD